MSSSAGPDYGQTERSSDRRGATAGTGAGFGEAAVPASESGPPARRAAGAAAGSAAGSRGVQGGRPPGQSPPPGQTLFDSHTHLDIIGQPVPGVLAAAHAAGIERVITVGIDRESSRWSARCAAEYPSVFAAVAIHPNNTAAATGMAGGETAAEGGDVASADVVLAEIETLAGLPQVRAVGETGLDYYRDHSDPALQREWFRAHIGIAKRTGKALMIHDRDAHEDVLRILAEEGAPDKVVFHCFSGDEQMAKRCADQGYVMSFAGNLTFASAQNLRDAAAAAPADLLLVETDAPFLTPVPYRGKPNSPALAAYTARRLAEVKNMDLAELCTLVTATGERIFGPW